MGSHIDLLRGKIEKLKEIECKDYTLRLTILIGNNQLWCTWIDSWNNGIWNSDVCRVRLWFFWLKWHIKSHRLVEANLILLAVINLPKATALIILSSYYEHHKWKKNRSISIFYVLQEAALVSIGKRSLWLISQQYDTSISILAEGSTLQFILPIAGKGEILLKWSDADPSGFRYPLKGSISTVLEGSISTSNLLRASCVLNCFVNSECNLICKYSYLNNRIPLINLTMVHEFYEILWLTYQDT